MERFLLYFLLFNNAAFDNCFYAYQRFRASYTAFKNHLRLFKSITDKLDKC